MNSMLLTRTAIESIYIFVLFIFFNSVGICEMGSARQSHLLKHCMSGCIEYWSRFPRVYVFPLLFLMACTLNGKAAAWQGDA